MNKGYLKNFIGYYWVWHHTHTDLFLVRKQWYLPNKKIRFRNQFLRAEGDIEYRALSQNCKMMLEKCQEYFDNEV